MPFKEQLDFMFLVVRKYRFCEGCLQLMNRRFILLFASWRKECHYDMPKPKVEDLVDRTI
jgi:hypothetical protein